MKDKVSPSMTKIILAAIILIVPILGVIFLSTDTNMQNNMASMAVINGTKKESTTIDIEDKVVIKELATDYCDTKCFLDSKADTINFMSKTFGINSSDIYADLIQRNSDGVVNPNNIGRLNNTYPSFERGLVEYMFDYAAKNPNKVSNTYVPYTGGSTYVENLIKYFSSIYPEVDYLTAISIGAAESGYYQSKYMLSVNNVYGGMGKGGLVKYKNIEYGILSYIKYLAEGYYNKGLNTIETIGYKYCPTTNESGQKIVSPHWVNLVYKAKSHYANTNNNISVLSLN